jgi:WD40 repeat protein
VHKKKTISSFNEEGKLLKAPRIVLKGHRLAVTCVGVLQSPTREETLVFTGSEDKRVLVWSLKTGEHIAELNGHTQKITSIATFNSSGYNALVITAGWDERVRIWPVEKCFTKAATKTEEFATGGPETGNEVPVQTLSESISAQSVVLRGHKNRIFGLAVIHGVGEEPVVASGSSDNTIRVWSLPMGELLYILEDERDDTWNLCLRSWFVSLKHFTKCGYHGTVLLSGCKNNTVRVWKHRSAAQIRAQAQVDSEARAAALQARAGSSPAQSFVSRKAPSVPALVIRGHRSAVHSLAPFDAQEMPFVATACKDFDVRIWSLLTGTVFSIAQPMHI